MSDICPVCDKEFDSNELFDKHVEAHLNEPTINEPIENIDVEFLSEKKYTLIDFKKIFSEEKFENLVKLKMEKVIVDAENLKKQNFIEQIKKINRRNPFLYMPYFIKDFMNGISTKDIEYKYHIWFWMDHRAVTHNILALKENRYLARKYDNAFELNLKIVNWKDKYQELENNCRFFKNELDELVFDNVLQAGIIFLLMDKKCDKDEIFHEIRRIKDHYDLYHFVDDSLVNRFNEILEVNLEERIDNILFGLRKEGVIKRAGIGSRKLITTFSIDKIKNNIIRELKIDEKIVYATLRNMITEQFPALKLIPKFGVFDIAWTELEKEGKIHIEYRSRRRNDFVIFLNEDYLKIQQRIDSIEIDDQNISFKGRKITPEKFVDELLELEKGDFGDADDQVTRMAGLVLAESVKLQLPHEDIPEFDFTINLKDYNFRPEQLNAMSKLNFKINSEIFHVKVMINETLGSKKYKVLREKIPSNEQGVVITFKKIPQNVKKILANDSTIQIIDEEGVKIWASITSVLPSRVNSVCKIYFDPLSKLEDKIVKINSVFYEKGIALVTVFPEMNEETVLVRTLEEITLYELSPSDFSLFAYNYFEFVKILSTLTTNESLIDGLFKNKFEDTTKGSKTYFELKLDYNNVIIDLYGDNKKEIFNCDCMKYAENSLQLCSHLVTALDYVFRYFSYGDKTWNVSNKMKKALEILVQENVSLILDRLGIEDNFAGINNDNKINNFVLGISKIKNNF